MEWKGSDGDEAGRDSGAVVVAVAVAAAMFVGIVGLVVVAVIGNDDEPSGDGLERSIDVAAPATAQAAAPDAAAAPESESAPDDTAGAGTVGRNRRPGGSWGTNRRTSGPVGRREGVSAHGGTGMACPEPPPPDPRHRDRRRRRAWCWMVR